MEFLELHALLPISVAYGAENHRKIHILLNMILHCTNLFGTANYAYKCTRKSHGLVISTTCTSRRRVVRGNWQLYA